VELLSNPERAAVFGMAGLEVARTDFSVERMAERTLDVYERALAAR
jgi:glycosyltransferase involved in cell wall biosynthesis